MCIRNAARGIRQAGMSLVEVIIFIVIVGAGITVLVKIMANTTRYSADPMLQKQALAAAESLLEEIMLQPFTICDPNDPNHLNPNFNPASGADCTGGAGGQYDIGKLPLGSQATATAKTRDGAGGNPFNNVSDYAILAPTAAPMAGIRDINNNPIVELAGYTAIVNITQAGAAVGLADNTAALRIDVTVRTPKYSSTGATSEAVTLTGYRFRYAPVATP